MLAVYVGMPATLLAGALVLSLGIPINESPNACKKAVGSLKTIETTLTHQNGGRMPSPVPVNFTTFPGGLALYSDGETSCKLLAFTGTMPDGVRNYITPQKNIEVSVNSNNKLKVVYTSDHACYWRETE